MAQSENNRLIIDNDNYDEEYPRYSDFLYDEDTDAEKSTGSSVTSENSTTSDIEHNDEMEVNSTQDEKQIPDDVFQKIQDIEDDIKKSIENGIPSDEAEKESLTDKLENLIGAMDEFGNQQKTDKGIEKFDESKDYINDVETIINHINEGGNDIEIKEEISNLFNKTLPQVISDVQQADNEVETSQDSADTSNVYDNGADISQYKQVGATFLDALKQMKIDNKYIPVDILVNAVKELIPDIQDSEIEALSMAIYEIHDESQLEKINDVRAVINDEKKIMVNITKDHRFERQEDVTRFSRSIDRISYKIDNLSKNLTSESAISSCQELKEEFASKSDVIKDKLDELKLMSSSDQIKDFKREVYKIFDSIDTKIDEIKSNETVVLKSKDIEKSQSTGDATVDRWNAKEKNYEHATGLDRHDKDEKNNDEDKDAFSFLNNDGINNSSSSKTRGYKDNPVYIFRTLVRDIYANSRDVEIDGEKVTGDKIIGDLGEMLRLGIPGAVIVGVIELSVS